MLEYKSAVEFINTPESYSSVLFWGGNNVVIPYINLELMLGNPINGSQSVINYSYVLYIGVSALAFGIDNVKLHIKASGLETNIGVNKDICFMGGIESRGVEVDISYAESILVLKEASEISSLNQPFIPRNTPYYTSNMIKDDVDSFFQLQNLPLNIKKVLGASVRQYFWV